MEISEQHKTHRWKFLVGGVVISAISSLDDLMRATEATRGSAVGSAIYAIPVGLFLGYVVWWAWAKTKKLDS